MRSRRMSCSVLAGAVALATGSTAATAAATQPAASALEVGRPAPAFKLVNQEGKEVALADLRGQWVVLYFYPRAMTPGCTIQACDFSEGIEAFKKVNATVVGVSPDAPAALKQFTEKEKLKITLLSDPSKTVMGQYRAWQETEKDGKKSGRIVRSTVLIDPRGNLAYHWPQVSPKGHAEAVMRKLAELKDAGGEPKS